LLQFLGRFGIEPAVVQAAISSGLGGAIALGILGFLVFRDTERFLQAEVFMVGLGFVTGVLMSSVVKD